MVSIFDFIYDKYKITKPIRLIELFSGYGSQALALKYLGVEFEHYKTCEWAVKSIKAYNDLHMPKVKASATAEQLYELGISMDYNQPMTLDQIKKKGQDWCDDVYSSIVATNDLVDVSRAHIELTDRDKYTYLMTYSFPCQDLSLAGKRAGIKEGTRSGLLSQVERILREGTRPDILLMENVPQVISEVGFKSWILYLESIGYTSYYKVLNAKDFGIPQNRKRCFMVSILGAYNYSFPEKIKLKLKLKDLLETDVDERYYLSQKMIDYIAAGNDKWTGNNDKSLINKSIASTLNTGEGSKRCDASNYICSQLPEDFDIKEKIVIDSYNKKITNPDYVGTIPTGYNRNQGSVIGEYTLKQQKCDKLIKDGDVQEGDIIKHSFTSQIMKGNKKAVEKSDEMITLTTRGDCFGVVVKVGNYSPSGHNASQVVDPEGVAPTVMENHGTITAIPVKESYSDLEKSLFTEDGNIKRYVDSDIVDEFKDGQMAMTSYPNGYGHGTRVHNESIALTANERPSVKVDLRIRKLTPRECWRLMGVLDEDFEKVNQSNNSLYHLAGDSIVTTVLMAIFGELLGIDYQSKIENLIKNLKKL